MMTKIAFEAQLLLKGNKTGIGWCADNLIRGLLKEPEYDCQLNYFPKACEEDKLLVMEEYRNDGATLNPCVFLKMVWYKMIWPILPVPYHWFFGSDAQITQFFNYVVPPGVKGKTVTMVHDMAHLACRDTVRLKTRKWLDLTLESSCRRADVIVTVSEFSKSEIIKYMNISEERIQVMYPGVDLNLFHDHYTEEQVNIAKEKYGIKGDYILYLGTIEPRKNVQRLIEAYEKLLDHSDSHSIPQLVLAGGKGWLCDDIYRAAEKEKLKGNVMFTGYIAAEDSPLLLSGASLFCFPSVYEGFGTPPIEAMACGTPVLAGNAASIPEVLGECAVYVDPFSTDDIAEKLEQVLRDKELRKLLSLKGPEHAKRYDWANSVARLKIIYENLLKNEG